MSDQGAIGVFRRLAYKRTLSVWSATHAHASLTKAEYLNRAVRRHPTWRYDGTQGITAPNNGFISGVVQEGGVVIPYAIVALYYRPNGFLISRKRCTALGQFLFNGLDPSDAANYTIVAFDPAGGTQYNALIYDLMTAANGWSAAVSGIAAGDIGSATVNYAADSAFNPAETPAGYTLSATDHRITNSSAGVDTRARSFTSRDATDASGFYYEDFINTKPATASVVGVGLSTASDGNGSAGYVGKYAGDYAIWDTGNKFNNNAGSAHGGTFVTGMYVGVLAKNGKIYFWYDTTGWQNGADPVAETGYAYSGVSGLLIPTSSVSINSASVTINTGGSAFANGSLPSGVRPWG